MEKSKNRIISRLTKEDKKVLFEEAKPKIVISTFIFSIGLIMILGFTAIQNHSKGYYFTNQTTLYLLLFFAFCVIFSFIILRKTILDFRCGEKYVERKKIIQKQFKIDYEPGSATLYIGQEMKPVDSYNLFVEGIIYNVEKDFYNSVTEGDEVYFHLSIHTKELLKMEKLKQTNYE